MAKELSHEDMLKHILKVVDNNYTLACGALAITRPTLRNWLNGSREIRSQECQGRIEGVYYEVLRANFRSAAELLKELVDQHKAPNPEIWVELKTTPSKIIVWQRPLNRLSIKISIKIRDLHDRLAPKYLRQLPTKVFHFELYQTSK